MQKKPNKKRFWFTVIILLLVFFTALQLVVRNGFFTLQNLRYHRELIQSFVNNHYVLSVLIYWSLYVIENVFALPIAAFLNISAGYFYGTIPATIFTVIAATSGALISFSMARFLLGDYIQVVYKERLAKFNKEFEQHGVYYLLTVRFFPFIPFVLVNMFAGLTLVPVSTFVWTTAVGMTPLAVMHALAGNQLQTIESVHDILSWQMIVILGLLAVLTFLPLMLKKRGLFNGYK